MPEYFKIEDHILFLLAAGIIALLAAVTPVLTKTKYITAPIIYMAVGIATYYIWMQYELEPLENLNVVKYITEFVLLVALTNTGLKIKEPFSWKTWKYSIRLLIIAMPLTILAGAYLGWYIAGLAPATAVLFGALISPTDPVLAAELQTSPPSREDTSKVKLALTSEAGINDGLAFPFIFFAIFMAKSGTDIKEWIWTWFLHDFIIKIAIAIVIGLLCGWLLYKIIFSITTNDKLSKISRGILALSLTLIPYAVTESIRGYGFMAVFIAACIFSKYEKDVQHMDSLHAFNEELESFMVGSIFVVTGAFIALHVEILDDFDVILLALVMILIVRPVTGYISLIRTDLTNFEKFVLSFYGIRGIGSMFYLAYALTVANFDNSEKLLAVTTVTIFLSVLIHGFTARKVQIKIKKTDPEA